MVYIYFLESVLESGTIIRFDRWEPTVTDDKFRKHRIESPRDGGLAFFLQEDGPPLSLYDLEDALHEMFNSVKDVPPEFVRFDGVFALDEPDHDNEPLVVGDRVRVSYVGTLGIPAHIRPFYYGTVQSIEPWSEDLADHIFVLFDHAKRPEHGSWWERDCISKVKA